MDLQLTTPALLFPAISLLLLAYTNRFLTLAQLIRQLHTKRKTEHSDELSRQIDNLNKRMTLIIIMQSLGVLSIIGCSVTMFLIYIDSAFMASLVFGLSLILMVVSLIVSLIEILISGKALRIEMMDMGSED